MATSLPEEIWIVILGYVSLEDRMKQLQFVNRKFYELCHDPTLTKSLDFSNAIFMPEKMCRRLVRRSKNWVTDISFKGCHWLPGSLFSRLCQVPNLHTLDVTGCFLNTVELHQLLSKTLNLRNLALSLRSNSKIFRIDSEPPECLNMYLDKLHIECRAKEKDLQIRRHFGRLDKFEYSKFLSGLMLSYFLQWFGSLAHLSLSLELFDKLYEFKNVICMSKPCLGLPLNLSKLAADFDCPWYVGRVEYCRELCCRLSKIGLHSQVPDESQSVEYDLSEVKYLSLPEILIPWDNHDLIYSCTGCRCPDSLPNLECLIAEVDIWEPPVLHCYHDIKEKLLLACDYPKLKCLNIGRSVDKKQAYQAVAPQQFYSRISLLQNLEELNLRHLPIDLSLLLNTVKSLHCLHSLSFTLNETLKNCSSINATTASSTFARGQRISRYAGGEEITFFRCLVDALPDLKKLEISQGSMFRNIHSAKIFEPIGDLSKLEVLSVSDIPFIEAHLFSNMLKKCANLRSLTVSNIGKAGNCDYSRLFLNTLGVLHKLVELRLQHNWLDFTQALSDELCFCKSIEKLVFIRNGGMDVTAVAMVKQFEVVMNNCPRLHMFAYITQELAQSVSQKIYQYQKNLKRTGRRASIFCGVPEQESPKIPMVLVKLIDFTKSVIGTRNAYEYFNYRSC